MSTYTLYPEDTLATYSANRSDTCDFTSITSSDEVFIGYTNSKHRAVSFFFNSSVMNKLYSLGKDNITSAKLKIISYNDKGSDNYPAYLFGGIKADTNKTSSKIGYEVHDIYVTSGTPKNLDLTTMIKEYLSETRSPFIPAFTLGSYDNTKTNYVAFELDRSISTNMVFTVETTEEDITLYYDANGGSGAPSSQTQTSIGSISFTISSTVPTRSGYVFKGWSKSSTASSATYVGGNTISISSNTTLYAVWWKNYTLSYDSNGGVDAPPSQTGYGYSSCSFIISSTIPTRTGYNFLGWSTSSSATTADEQPNTTIVIIKDIVLYAVWSIKTYSIKYYANPGRGTAKSQTKSYGTSINLLDKTSTNYIRAGCDYDGWATVVNGDKVYEFGASYQSNSSVSLYPHWTHIDTIHCKIGNYDIFGGQIYVKKGNSIYEGSIWEKIGNTLYEGK